MNDTADILVSGNGPTGLSAALALARQGWRTICVGQPPSARHSDTRTSALFRPTLSFLRSLGIWEACRDRSAPLEAIRLVDVTGHLVRAPEVLFRAHEVGVDAFGENVPNAVLTAALRAAALAEPALRLVETTADSSISLSSTGVAMMLDGDARFTARLLVGADGRHSPTRAAAGIGLETWAYPQSAIACSFTHSRPHRNISTELHGPDGPFTVVPLPGLASSLVWVDRPETCEAALTLDDRAFADLMEERLEGLLGRVTLTGRRAVFPLSGARAVRMTAPCVALVGEAAHVIPPIGAQGLNLGLRDVATLAECLGPAAPDAAPNEAAALAAYASRRSADVWSRTAAVDLLNRTLLSPYIPAHMLRGAGLHLLKNMGPLRRLVMQEGMGPTHDLPDLMRPRATDATSA